GARVRAGLVPRCSHRARDGTHRIDAQAEEPGAGGVARAARSRRLPAPPVHAVRAGDGAHAALRDRAARGRHDRGPSRMSGSPMGSRLRRGLAGAALLLAAQWCLAQPATDEFASTLFGQGPAAGTDAGRSAADLLRAREEAMLSPADA